MAENQPSKTFWQPLSFGLVLLIFLGAQLVATGVKSEEQEDILRRNGVELFCGDLYARPDACLPKVSFSR